MGLRIAFLAFAISGLATVPVLASAESDVATYCKADVERLCKGIPMGGGKILDCLKKNEKEISVGCAEALKKLQG